MIGRQKTRTIYKLLVHERLHRKRHKTFLFGSIAFSCVVLAIGLSTSIITAQATVTKEVLGAAAISPTITIIIEPSSTPTPTPTSIPTPVPTAIPKKHHFLTPTLRPATPTPINVNKDQYTAQKINDVTWKVSDVSNDDHMASSQEIINALNSYRQSHGASTLSVDDKLMSYAQERANLFAKNGSLDSHVGFRSFMDNGGFDISGFNSLGENSAIIGGPMSGDKIIRNIFGADESHDGNQLDNWTHVGVGVNGLAINVNFGKNKK